MKDGKHNGGPNYIVPDYSSRSEPDDAPSGDTPTAGDLKSMVYLSREYNEPDLLDVALETRMPLASFQKKLLARVAEKQREQNRTVILDDRLRHRSLGHSPNSPLPAGGSHGSRGHVATQSLEDEVFASREFEAFRTGRGQRGINLELKWRPHSRATFLTSTGLTSYDRPPGVVILDQEFARVSSLFRTVQTSSPTVRVTQEVSFTNAADAVAEEGLKPEATFDLVETDFPIRKIAVFGRTTDEVMKDFPQAFDYLQGRLRESVELKFDSELVNGTGLSNRITGILATSNIQTQPSGTYPLVFDAIAAAVNKVQKNGHVQPDGIILSPDDFLTLRLTKDGQARYFLGGPGEATLVFNEDKAFQGRVWSLPVVVSSMLAQGTAIVGAFAKAGFIAMREGLRLEMTNSDASDFQYNRIAIRAELRAALVIAKPLAFCTVTGITGP